MKFALIKQTLIGFTVFLTILALGSCGVAEDTAPPGGSTTFQQDIENATTVPNLVTANALTREVLEPLNVATGTPLVKRYVTETGGGSRDGTSWANAWAAVNLRSAITNITDATANRVYLVMVAGGTYKPDYSTTVTTTERAISFSMTNHVAIMGGFQTGGGWGRTGTTMFSGDIGTVGTTTDNTYQVFSHTSITLSNAHLYGVTITGGNANGGASPQFYGGGMFNQNSSPVLTEVVFSGNTVATNGGGMYNRQASPVLTRVEFSGNTADGGGGMANRSSSPVLTEVVFSGNTATGNGSFGGGGGMHNNISSSPVLTRVVFSGNTTTGIFGGGGMYNGSSSSPVLTNVVFSGNTATRDGGGMYNSGASQVLIGAVFINNTAANGGGMYNVFSSPVLTSVVFSGNTAQSGGGMHNVVASPVLVGAVFRNNTAANGGGMYNDNGGQPGPLIVNSIFSANTLSGSGSGTNILVNRDTGGAENIRIAGSVLGIGLAAPAQPTNAIVGYNGTDPLNISNYSLANGAVRFGADANFTVNGMNFPYPTITTGSSAINIGLYVRKHVNAGATTYYFSETGSGTTWHTGFTSTDGLDGTAEDLPATGTIEDLTATDIAGNARSGRPDAGVYELP